MKKIITLVAILAALTACNNTEVKEESSPVVVDKSNIYMKDGKAYTILDDQLFDGVTKTVDSYYGSIEILSYTEGVPTSMKLVEDGNLAKKLSYDMEGRVDGNFYYSNSYGETIEGTIINGLIQGEFISKYYGDTEKGEFVNSIRHGLTEVISEDGQSEKVYYNKGIKVASEAEVEDFEAITIADYPIVLSDLNEEDGLYTKDGKVYSGTAFYKDYYSYNYYEIVEGKLVKSTSYNENYVDGYAEQIGYFTINSVTEYKEDGNYAITNYDNYDKIGIFSGFSEYNSDDVLDGRVVELFWDGSRMEKNVVDGSIMGEAIRYDQNGKILEVHNYTENSYELTGYYDYEKGLKSVQGQGIRDSSGFNRDGKWIWYYENGNKEQEVDFYYLDDYSMSKIYYENGQLKEEGMMTLCACDYLGEVKKYSEDGRLIGIDIYDTEGNGEIIEHSDM